MNKNIVLASGSPRRKQLLDMCGLEFDVITADLDEEIIEKEINSTYSGKQSYYIAEKMVERLSREKALVVKDQAEKKYGEYYIVIGSDTLVVDENQILGKPKDKDDAYRILRSLCGKLHRVYTGVSLVYDDRVESFVSHTEVLFYDYDQKMEDIINKYIEGGSPMDKAGAYGIQDMGALLVKEIRGDYYTVMGLPLAELIRKI
ncbi:Maf family protein [Peptostreptococcus anaerobius]|uniref:Maf family protein n=1 Tax=Peptostreptococcus anaerobius TaxID=1261 RepID=UPI00189BF76D|nr:Maf family protein [Peptostreptococcus anaerobius]MDB8851677.1 Maf family protein [Peptostreptococcus anaerobius]